jgi:hypothetical protein
MYRCQWCSSPEVIKSKFPPTFIRVSKKSGRVDRARSSEDARRLTAYLARITFDSNKKYVEHLRDHCPHRNPHPPKEVREEEMKDKENKKKLSPQQRRIISQSLKEREEEEAAAAAVERRRWLKALTLHSREQRESLRLQRLRSISDPRGAPTRIEHFRREVERILAEADRFYDKEKEKA